MRSTIPVVFTILLSAAVALASKPQARGGITSNAAISSNSTFVAVEPCRVYDTRPSSILPTFTSRTIDVDGSPCGLPGTVSAYSFTLTVTDSTANGYYQFLVAYPSGTVRPNASSINFLSGAQVSGAAIVPAGTNGDVDIYASQATHVVIDVNGYYIEPVVKTVTAGAGLASTASSGDITLSVPAGGITPSMINTAGAISGQVLMFGGPALVWATPGDITAVVAGPGLTGGATSGSATLNVSFSGPGSATTVARSDHGHYVKTVIVSPVGTDAQNGTALSNALLGINFPSVTNRYLIIIEPGTYDLGATALTMRAYVDIQGSGELMTKITGDGSASAQTATVIGASNATIRDLTIENTGGAAFATAFFVINAAPFLERVALTATNTATARGMWAFSSAAPRLHDVRVTATTSGGFAEGLLFTSNSVPQLWKVVTNASAATVSQGLRVATMTSSAAYIRDSIFNGTGGSTARGLDLQDVTITFFNVAARATSATTNTGLRAVTGTNLVKVINSHLVGATNTFEGGGTADISIAHSWLEGGPPLATRPSCYGAFDENFTAPGLTVCP